MSIPLRKTAAVAAVGLGIAGLAACSGGSDGTGQGDKGAKIVLNQWYHEYGEEGTREAVERYAAEYTKLHPDVEIKITWVPGEYPSKLNAALMTDEGPDIFDSGPVGERIFAGQVATVDDLFGDSLSDFNSKNIEAVTVDGHIYGIPMSDGDGLLFYDKAALKQANVEPPKTMDELIAAAKKLTNGERKGLFIGNDGCTSGQISKVILWSSGIELIKDGKVAFDNPRAVMALQKMGELCNSGSLLMGAPQDWFDSSAFMDGLTAMQWGGQWTLPAVQEELGDSFGVIPWPALDAEGQPATWFGGWYEQINAKSKHLEAAKDYVKWLWIENTDAQLEWSTAFGSTAPVRQSIIDQAEGLKEPPAKTFVEAISKYGHLESGPYWSNGIEAAINKGVIAVVRDGADPAQEVKKAAQTAQQELDAIAADSKLK